MDRGRVGKNRCGRVENCSSVPVHPRYDYDYLMITGAPKHPRLETENAYSKVNKVKNELCLSVSVFSTVVLIGDTDQLAIYTTRAVEVLNSFKSSALNHSATLAFFRLLGF